MFAEYSPSIGLLFGNGLGSYLSADVDFISTKQGSHLASPGHSLGLRGFPTARWGRTSCNQECPELLSTRLRRRPRQADLRQGARSVRPALPSMPCERSHSTPGPAAVGIEVVCDQSRIRDPPAHPAAGWEVACEVSVPLRVQSPSRAPPLPARWRRAPNRCPFGHCWMRDRHSLRSHAPGRIGGVAGQH